MPTAIERRVIKLEHFPRPRPRATDLGRLTDAELRQQLMESLCATIADPASSPEQASRAEAMLALPWGRPDNEWTVEQLVLFRDETHRRD